MHRASCSKAHVSKLATVCTVSRRGPRHQLQQLPCSLHQRCKASLVVILLACWAEALGTKRVLLQSNHGPMICAESMDVAFDYLVSSMFLTLHC